MNGVYSCVGTHSPMSRFHKTARVAINLVERVVLLDLVEGSAHAGEEALLHVGEEVWLPGTCV